jgi:hypothetical protein
VVAAPISPKPAACASGEILNDGIEVIIGLVAIRGNVRPTRVNMDKRIFFICFIDFCLLIIVV